MAEDKKNIKESQSNKLKYIEGVGRRKEAVARVRIFQGKGNITVNEESSKDYFGSKLLEEIIMSPIKLVSLDKKFDISAKVSGGGIKGQAEAIRHGLTRALVKKDETLKQTFKKAGYLTRDSREKERKKYGLHKARKASQFRKR